MRRCACWMFAVLISVATIGLPSQASDQSIVNQKSNQQAAEGRMRHVGGSFGSGRYEGVGFSTVSADHAIRNCCYWGQRTPVAIGVSRGANGWYATVLYR